MNASIYILKDPESCKVRYVGFTTGDVTSRLAEHIAICSSRCGHRNYSSKEKRQWIYNLLKANMVPQVEIVEQVPEEMARCREHYWMLRFAIEGCDLLNRGILPTKGFVDDSTKLRPIQLAKKYLLNLSSVNSLLRRLTDHGFVNANTLVPAAKRRTQAIRYHFDGKSLKLSEWSKLKGISLQTLRNRMLCQGWQIEKALTTKPRQIIGGPARRMSCV